MSVEFLITTLVVVATPGTGVLYTVAAGLARGARASVVAAVGCTLGTLPHVLAAVTGLAALLHTSAVAFQVVKYAGVAYLLYMAWNTIRDTASLAVVVESGTRLTRQVIVSGVLVDRKSTRLNSIHANSSYAV